jgi:hypothetical protein
MSKSRGSTPPTDATDYEVGYGRPPQGTRFQPGRSGNPRCRPRKPKTVGALLQQGLSRRVEIKENGCTRRRSAEEIVVMQLINKAAKGELGATKLLFYLKKLYEDSPEDHLDPVDLQADKELLDAFLARQKVGEAVPEAPVEQNCKERAQAPADDVAERGGEDE